MSEADELTAALAGSSTAARSGKQRGMLAIVAAIIFAIAWIINATG